MDTDNILGVIGLLLLIGYVAWDMPPTIERSAGKVTIRYAWWVRCYFLVAAFAIPLGITVLGIYKEPKGSEMGCFIGLYALFGVLSVPWWWMTTRFAATISDAGLECHSPWRGKRFVPWSEVVGLTRSEVVQWDVLQTRDGYRFRIPWQAVPGLPLLQSSIDHHVRRNQPRNKG
jgi:hypothetical protein